MYPQPPSPLPSVLSPILLQDALYPCIPSPPVALSSVSTVPLARYISPYHLPHCPVCRSFISLCHYHLVFAILSVIISLLFPDLASLYPVSPTLALAFPPEPLPHLRPFYVLLHPPALPHTLCSPAWPLISPVRMKMLAPGQAEMRRSDRLREDQLRTQSDPGGPSPWWGASSSVPSSLVYPNSSNPCSMFPRYGTCTPVWKRPFWSRSSP